MDPCEAYRPNLEAHVDGELPDDQARTLSSHVAECPRCAAYQAELVRLRDGLERLKLTHDAPDLADAVVARLMRRTRLYYGLAASGLVMLKLLDVLGVFGDGAMPRLVVAAAIVTAFLTMRINPFRLVRPEELARSGQSVEGVNHAVA